MRVRTALRSSSTNYSIAAPCVHLAAHAVSCVWGRAVRFDAQLGCASGRVRLVRSHTMLPATARWERCRNSETFADRARSSPGQRLRHGKEKDWGTNAPSVCGAKPSRRCRTSRRWRETGAPKRRGRLPCLVAAAGDVTLGRGITVLQGEKRHGEQAVGSCCVFLIGVSDGRTDRR